MRKRKEKYTQKVYILHIIHRYIIYLVHQYILYYPLYHTGMYEVRVRSTRCILNIDKTKSQHTTRGGCVLHSADLINEHKTTMAAHNE